MFSKSSLIRIAVIKPVFHSDWFKVCMHQMQYLEIKQIYWIRPLWFARTWVVVIKLMWILFPDNVTNLSVLWKTTLLSWLLMSIIQIIMAFVWCIGQGQSYLDITSVARFLVSFQRAGQEFPCRSCSVRYGKPRAPVHACTHVVREKVNG